MPSANSTTDPFSAPLDGNRPAAPPPCAGGEPSAGLLSVLSEAAAASDLLQRAAEAIQADLDAPHVSIWILDETAQTLNVEAAAGIRLPADAAGQPIPLGETEIGQIAVRRNPQVSNDLAGVDSLEVRRWIQQHGLVAFAGYPLVIDQRLFGVLVIFARRRLEEQRLKQLAGAARAMALALDRRLARTLQQESSELVLALFRATKQAVVGWNCAPQVTHWNTAAEHMFGRNHHEVLGRRACFVDRASEELLLGHIESALAGRTVGPIEAELARPDGSHVDVAMTVTPRRGAGGEIVGVLAVLEDIARKKRAARLAQMQHQITRIVAAAETTRQAAPHLIRAVCEAMRWPCGAMWLVEQQQDALQLQAAWHGHGQQREKFQSCLEQIQYLPGAGLPGQVWKARNQVWKPDIAEAADPLAADIRKQPLRAGLGLPLHDGDDLFGVLAFYADSIDKPDGKLAEELAYAADQIAGFIARQRTEASLRESETNLRQAQKMDGIGLLAGGVAHDFNNLLTVILAFSELGADEVQEEGPLREAFCEIHDAGQRAASLTRQLLAFSRKQIVLPVELNLNEVIDNMRKMLVRMIGEKIVLDFEPCPRLHLVKADPAQMEQVLLNLVVNARDAMPNGGRITIRTESVTLGLDAVRGIPALRPGDHVRLSVSDTGCGMDEKVKARIFDPFFTTKAPGKGTGMGLSTIYGIVTQSGGHITVDSAVGRGTTFGILLPKVQATLATQVVTAKPEDLPRGSETILLVEDEDVLRGLVRRVLQLRGYQVLEARDGTQAWELHKRHSGSIDLLLTDVVMPGMDGPQLAGRLTKARPGTKVLYMSGYTDDRIQEDDLAKSGGFIQKPFTTSDIARKVREMLGG